MRDQIFPEDFGGSTESSDEQSRHHRTDAQLKALIARYRREQAPLEVNFRALVPWLPYQCDRATHLSHPYPAKLLQHIPVFFLNNSVLSKKDDLVLDPFCGSGTVLVESLLAGRRAFGADSNPFARLLARAKTSFVPRAALDRALERILTTSRTLPEQCPPSVVNISHWFYPHVIKQLSRLKAAIEIECKGHSKEFFAMCFSACARRVSLADPRISVPVKLRSERYPIGSTRNSAVQKRLNRLRRVNVFNLFKEIAQINISRSEELHKARRKKSNTVRIFSDARNLSRFTVGKKSIQNSVQLVITSPPYAGAQKYVRASSLSIGWLGLSKDDKLRALEAKSIGREHYCINEYSTLLTTGVRAADALLEEIRLTYPLRAHIAGNYLKEMKEAISEIYQILKPKGYFVLVAGNNTVCEKEFETQKYLTSIAKELGFKVILELVDAIKSRGLMTKRNKTASLITREWVTLLQKP